MSSDIHAITEIFDAIDAACTSIDSAASDGKLTITDVRFLLAPIKDTITAVRARGELVEEIKDLDGDELAILADRVATTAAAVTKAVSEIIAVA